MSELAALPLPAVEGIQWEKVTSKNGVAYEATEKPSEEAAGEQNALAGGEAGFQTVEVNWPVGDGTWKEPGAASALGIKGYILTKRPGIFDYILHIVTDKSDVTYTFTDGEPDSYKLGCSKSGEHSVSYNSDKPTIKYVQLNY